MKAVYCERDRFFNIFTMPQANHDYLDLGPIEFLKGIRAFMKKGPGSKNNSFALANFTGNKLRHETKSISFPSLFT